ncbi:MAG: hypothetical protein AAAFM81_12035, partial [Pseudomonadota bacterium]
PPVSAAVDGEQSKPEPSSEDTLNFQSPNSQAYLPGTNRRLSDNAIAWATLFHHDRVRLREMVDQTFEMNPSEYQQAVANELAVSDVLVAVGALDTTSATLHCSATVCLLDTNLEAITDRIGWFTEFGDEWRKIDSTFPYVVGERIEDNVMRYYLVYESFPISTVREASTSQNIADSNESNHH